MEDDRALVGLGTAADIEESQLEVHKPGNETTENAAPTTRQPKRRFVGRRAADEAAAAKATTEEGGSGAVQGTLELQAVENLDHCFVFSLTVLQCSRQASTSPATPQQSAQRNIRRPQHQGSHRPATSQLQLRDPQDDTPSARIWSQESGAADA